MSYLQQVREAVGPLTNDPHTDWHIREQDFPEGRLRVFAKAPATLRAMYEKAAQDHADAPFLVYEDEPRASFSQAWEEASALGRQLVAEYGVQKGDRVAIAMRNFPEWVTAFMAITSVGGIAVCMNAWWVSRELEYGFEDSGAKLAFVDAERLERMDGWRREKGVRVIGVRLPQPVEGADDYRAVVDAGRGQPMPAVEMDGEDHATILYTSGTTGFPKGAVANHRSVVSAVLCLEFGSVAAAVMDPKIAAVAFNPPFPPSILLTVPLFHVTGLVAILLSCFRGGRKMVLMYKWDPGKALELIERERATAFTGVPTMVWEMMEHPEFASRDTSSLVMVGGGGAPAPEAQVRKVESGFEGRPGLGYGLTETNAVTATNFGDAYLERPRSTGIPAILCDVSIRDESGNEVPVGERGEICVRGAFVFQGYWNNPEATAEALKDGWFHSGDIGRVDEDGFLYVEDRAKQMVLRGGENIYCAEVENAIYEIEGVVECAVFGLPDERLGEKVAAALRVRPGAGLTEGQVRQGLVDKLAKFKIPEVVILQEDELPRGATGKIQKRDIRDAILAAEGGA